MLAKFSVRKPMTVLVAVILVIVLGVVAFTRMTPDLLPSMDFPYVVVVTTYVGASPEKVESELTKPIEQAAATLEGIQEITSTSSANYSLVILEFNEDINMDAVTMNLREKLDQLSGAWADEVTNPTILKINPDMLPVNVSAVARDGYNTTQLSDLVSNTLLPRLEGIDGVATVSLSGTIFEKVNVVISQEKLDVINRKIRDAISEQFEEPRQEIEDALTKIEDSRSQLATGEKKLNSGSAQMKTAEKEMNDKFNEAQSTLDSSREQLKSAYEAAQQGVALMDSYSQAVNARSALEMQISALPPQEEQTEEQQAMAQQLSAQLAALNQQIDAMTPYLLSEEDLAAANALIAGYDMQTAALDEGQKTLDEQKVSAQAELENAKKQLSTGRSQLQNAKGQLDDAEDELNTASEDLDQAEQDAWDAADIHNIVTMDTVSAILSAQDFAMPAGYATDSTDTQWLVYVGDAFDQADELEPLMLFDMHIEGLDPIYLRDVADVFVVDNADTTYGKINGENGVMLTFNKQSNYATATVSENILKELRELEEEYEGVHFTSLMDQGDYIHLVVNSVLENLLLGGVLAIVILLIFLWDIRPTFIVACSIPISVTFAIVLMYFSGVTLNLISMSGLAVGVGMLVDNSIVVIENIYRLRKNGESVLRSAVSGAVQVAGAVTASTLTTVCVFVPIVFVEGITRQIFQDMALTITYSLMASLIVALTLVPAMSGGLLKRVSQSESHSTFFGKTMNGYSRVLEWTLGHKAVVILAVIVLLAVSAYGTLRKGYIFMPSMDSTQVTVDLSLDPDATLAENGKIADEIGRRFAEIPEVETVGILQSQGLGGMVGLSGMGGDSSALSMYVVLKEDKSRSSAEIAAEMESLCEDLDCEVSASGSGMDMSMLTGSGISIQVFGENLDDLQTSAQNVAEQLRTLEGVESVSDGMDNATPEFRVHVNKQKAMEHGLTTAQVYMSIMSAMTNEKTVGDLESNGNDVILIGSKDGVSLDSIKNLLIDTTNKDGKKEKIALKDIADFDDDHLSAQSIKRINQRRYMTVGASLKEGYNVTLVNGEAEKLLQDFELPDGVRLEFTGENESIMDAMKDLLLMLVLGIVIVYLIMVAQFQSLLSPFIVMFTIPLAFTGGLLALWICGFEISIISMIGFIMLVGIIVNNGIVLIDCMNQLRAEGMGLHESVVEACRQRMRPVLMTALTTILGLIPMAVGSGMGASMVQPVAVVAIGGLVYATLMTLFVVPVIYEAWCRKPPRTVSSEDLEIIEE